MPNLVEAIKSLRDPLGNDVKRVSTLVQGAEQFLFRPVNDQTIAELGAIVDRNLVDYASKVGIKPIVGPGYRHTYGLPDNIIDRVRDGYVSSILDNIAGPVCRTVDLTGVETGLINDVHTTSTGTLPEKIQFDDEHTWATGTQDSVTGVSERLSDGFTRNYNYNTELTEPRCLVSGYGISKDGIQIEIVLAPAGSRIDHALLYKMCTTEDRPTTKKELIKWEIKNNLTILIKGRSRSDGKMDPTREVARETLRESVSEFEYRRYLKYGFILVRGGSGRVYQISSSTSHTKIWERGSLVEEVCLAVQGVPPEDRMLAHKILIENDEESFKKMGNVYKKVA